MSKEPLILEVSDRSFEIYVTNNSDKVPVFVIFMNIWSEPSTVTADILSNLAKEFAGQFILAKVDIEENEQLTQHYKITNVPTLKVIVNGKVAASEEGQLTEKECRVLLKQQKIFDAVDELRLEAREHHLKGETHHAIELLTQAIKKDPSNTRIIMDMVQVFIDMDEIKEANALFDRIPESVKTTETGVSLTGQLWVINEANKTAGIKALKEAILLNPDDYNARFDCAVCEIARHNTQQALNHLFYIQEKQADFKEGAAREMIVTIINSIAPNNPEAANDYRNKLASLLSS